MTQAETQKYEISLLDICKIFPLISPFKHGDI
jgi:hypothetical protein